MGNSSHKADNNKGQTKQNGNNATDRKLDPFTEAEQNALLLAQLKERKRQELLAFEELQARKLAEELQLQNESQHKRNQFLSHVTHSQKQLEHQIAEVHQKQEQLRRRFTEELCKTETEMELSIMNILKNIRAHRDNAQELVKSEEAQTQAILALKREEFTNLRKPDILDAMKKQLEQDISCQQSQNKNSYFQAIFTEDEVKNDQIQKILQHRKNDQDALVLSLLEEESWQREAFSSLLSRRDRRTAELAEDIRSVVDQLNELTNWEMQRKSQKLDNTTTVIEENRRQLAELLAQLIEQQLERRKDLKYLLEEMETQRANQAADYWLVQYQRLMENVPEVILNKTQSVLPSAPPAYLEASAEIEASAPPMEVYMESNCVICMDLSSQVIFLPCGHLCCCNSCGQSVDDCPMCRAHVFRRLQVHT